MSAFYAYPKSCAFGRVVSKTKLFGATKASPALREKFTQQVSQIRWVYKLYPEGLNLTASNAVPEIQIFTIALKHRILIWPFYPISTKPYLIP